MIRLFVSLEIPETIRKRLFFLQGGVPNARWQTEKQMHLTLRFIGDVNEVVAQDVDDALSALRVPRFQLELAGVGEFSSKHQPHALWAGVRPSPELMHLQRKVSTALQRLGLPSDAHKYTPHVTLARLRHASQDKIVEFLTHNALFSSGTFAVDHFALFSSMLTSDGSVYRVERIYELE
jgi:2'-5' RNA ligase